LQWIERAGIPFSTLTGELLTLAATGIVLGFVAGAVAKLVLRTRLVGGELRNLSILALLMVCYLVADHQAAQSGILAAVVMGFTISAAELPDLVSVRAFKGQLTTLIISMLFILLAAQLDLGAIVALGSGGVIVVAILVVVVRPLAVALSIWPPEPDWRGRTVIALTAPRGIVAAAVASLAAREMSKAGVAGAEAMEGLVYLTILVTGAWSTFGAIALPRLLGYTKDPARRCAVLVGANALTETVARLLTASGRRTLAVDSVSWRLDRFRKSGLSSVIGDARDAATYEEAGIERDSLVLAATTNDELNLLVAELVHAEFGVEHPVVAIQQPPEEFGRRSRAWIDLFGGGATDVPAWIRRIENGNAVELTVDPDSAGLLAALHAIERENPNGVLRLIGFQNGQPQLAVSDERLPQLDRLTLLVGDDRLQTLLEPFRVADEEEPGVIEEVAANSPESLSGSGISQPANKPDPGPPEPI
jgi:hypothetical protein